MMEWQAERPHHKLQLRLHRCYDSERVRGKINPSDPSNSFILSWTHSNSFVVVVFVCESRPLSGTCAHRPSSYTTAAD